MTLLRSLATTIAVASLAVAAAAEEGGPRVVAVADLLGFSQPDRARLANGDLVSLRSSLRPLDEAAAVIVAASPAETMRALERADLFHANRRVLANEEIPAEPVDAATFAAIPIATPTLDEFANTDVGDDWNFSVTERALLKDTAREQGARGVAVAIRHILAERTAAYRSGGTRAIAAYSRLDGHVFSAGPAAAELWARFASLDAVAPGVYAAVRAYPRPASTSLRHSFYVSVVGYGLGSTTVLSHRVESAGDGYAIALDREFYVSRGYGVRQTVIGATATPDGRSIAFYVSSSAASSLPRQATVAGNAPTPSAVAELFAALRELGARSD